VAALGSLDHWVQSFDLHLRARGRTQKTRDTYAEALRGLSAHVGGIDLENITTQHIEGYIAELETRAPATAANRFRSLQAFFK
jgi:site-specific recombinase XerD